MDARRFLEDVGIAIARERHLPLGPREIRIGHAILPAHVVVAMDAGLVAGVAHGAHHIAGPSSDVRSGQQRAIEKRAHAVMLDDRRPLDFPHEARAENALDRPPRVIGSEREQERRQDAVLAKQLDEIGNALACSAQRVYVDLECEPRQVVA